MKTVAIIPARGGSKGIPGKNVMNFCGRPLLAWTIIQAKAAQCIDQVYVSSDCDEILKIAENYGAVPIKRPEDQSRDKSPSEEALVHALENIEQKPETVIFLQATSPLRLPGDIDAAYEKYTNEKCDSLFSGCLMSDLCLWEEGETHFKPVNFQIGARPMRQEADKLYHENGSIYIISAQALTELNSRFGKEVTMYKMPRWQSHEIDDFEDLELCQYYFKKRIRNAYTGDTKPKLIVYDFDGVMTDNTAQIQAQGKESVQVSRGDGLGVQMFKDAGVEQIILSTERNPVVLERAQKLGIPAISSCDDKATKLHNIVKERNLNFDDLAYVGNDLNDFEAMKLAGLKVAPADAAQQLLDLADIVTESKGGQGVVRELFSLLYKDHEKIS